MTTACRSERAPAPASTRDAAEQEGKADDDAGSRCKRVGEATPLGVPGDVVVGEASVAEQGIAIGLIRTAPADAGGGAVGTLAAVALLPPDGRSVRIVDIGPTSPDAPTPRLAWRGDSPELVVAGATAGDGLLLEQVGPDGASKQLFRSNEPRDPLSPFDLAVSGARGIVVWEASSRGPGKSLRGIVRAAAFEGSSRSGPSRDLSPVTSDAGDPRVIAWSSGYVALWVAGPADAPQDGSFDPAAAQPASFETATGRWLEGMFLDAGGVPLGPAKQLTPTVSQVASFDFAVDPFDKAAALVVARVESGPGREPSLEVFRLRANAANETGAPAIPSPELIARSRDLDPEGMSAPELLPGSMPLLEWSGPDDQLMMMPLVPGALAGADASHVSQERAFEDARPVASLANGRILAVAAPRARGGAAGAGEAGAAADDPLAARTLLFECSRTRSY